MRNSGTPEFLRWMPVRRQEHAPKNNSTETGSMTIRLRRSVLYMPGANGRAIDKARGLPVDAVIIDLEDAVAPQAKPAARAQVVEAMRQGGFAPREGLVRIKGFEPPGVTHDMRAV